MAALFLVEIQGFGEYLGRNPLGTYTEMLAGGAHERASEWYDSKIAPVLDTLEPTFEQFLLLSRLHEELARRLVGQCRDMPEDALREAVEFSQVATNLLLEQGGERVSRERVIEAIQGGLRELPELHHVTREQCLQSLCAVVKHVAKRPAWDAISADVWTRAGEDNLEDLYWNQLVHVRTDVVRYFLIVELLTGTPMPTVRRASPEEMDASLEACAGLLPKRGVAMHAARRANLLAKYRRWWRAFEYTMKLKDGHEELPRMFPIATTHSVVQVAELATSHMNRDLPENLRHSVASALLWTDASLWWSPASHLYLPKDVQEKFEAVLMVRRRLLATPMGLPPLPLELWHLVMNMITH